MPDTLYAVPCDRVSKTSAPKPGYSLDAAVSGDLNSGILAMRRAFQIDSESLHYINLNSATLNIIDSLIEKYQYKLKHDNNEPDEAFMISALNYLRHD